MTTRHFILATAGHVDHGKSALVKALTGVDPDRLPEEKARGITIELGFAHLELAAPNESEVFSIGVIDVPGHEDFVRKMVSGAGAIDLALLVVAADDGWMPQTEEHLHILLYLGVSRIVVALTKWDLVKDVEAAEIKVRAKLRCTPFADAAIVKTAAPASRGLAELREQIAREFASIQPQRDIDKPRLHVDRAFSLRGIGTVVTGTLTGGKLRRGETVAVQPGAISSRIRSLQNHNRDVEEIGPGTRVALNLTDIALASDTNADGVQRGDIVARTGSGEPTTTIDVFVTRLARSGAAPTPLRHGASVRVHHGSSNTLARIFLSEDETLAPGQAALAELRLTKPILAFAGDRVVIRDSAERHTLAGAVVLDPMASGKNFRRPAQREFLRDCSVMPLTSIRLIRAQLKRDRVVVSSSVLKNSWFSAGEILESIGTLASTNEIALRGELAVDASWWRATIRKAVTAVDAEHKAYPERAGLDLMRLRRMLALDSQQVFDALLADLAAEGIARTGDVVRRLSHRASLPPALQKIANDIRAALAVKSFDPPSHRDLTATAEAKQALRFLIQSNEVLEINEEVVLLRDAFFQMREAIVSFIRRNGAATVAELRQALGSSRRIMIPFLERLDRDGVTRRIGDKRELR